MQLIFASNNAGKIREVQAILKTCPGFEDVTVLSLKDIGFTEDIVEDGVTFEENALIKAKTVARLGYTCIADDSGLEVDALGGAPGVYSARYSGVHGNDAENNRLVLKNLEGVPDEKRTARFTCAIACVKPDGASFTVRASCEGRILHAEEGSGGFGYDPLFYVEQYEKTLASVTPEEKNAISHRGKAIRLFAERFHG
ncbi:MAG: XTP/dITP diphosphatase [Clostridia bacterium]|nr:XTP/dITP diphosphatase [Clostridia bacterium]MBO7170180.1 XTP/dITP diphosphatase [Clostridia bacterium]